ncbi:GTP-binding protein [Nocardia zapadnayensis]|uniref:GTP-binding protein n=1 Tax=Nocardia rhamnosiphila TaxID=426716 RepID=UPI002246E110|nr:GTP-binding protein [Nocardia zapadnayensis]MCX0275633.1 GTP-binding protein [Nocardia zapadnayensis]
MGIRAVDPQSIRNVTIVGEPAETTQVVRRLLRDHGRTPAATVVHHVPGRGEYTIRVAELSSHAPTAELERAIRVADGAIVVLNAATARAARFETILRVADDHQVARLCLVTGLDHPAADFDRCVRAIADTRGARPLPLHLPLGAGPGFDGVIDLVPMWALEPMAAEFYGSRWQLAEQWYRDLVAAVTEQHDEDPDADRGPRKIPPGQLHNRIRSVTRIGEAVPVLCDAARHGGDNAALLDAIVRYLPSPLLVCQPEHALDY